MKVILALMAGVAAALNWGRIKSAMVSSFTGFKRLRSECPLATQSPTVNSKNKSRAVDLAGYGPERLGAYDNRFWQEFARSQGVDVEQAKGLRCGTCGFFNQTESMLACIGTDGDLGYCEAFDFVCSARRTCKAWVIGGPIT